jgi:hypothetical protein
MPGPIARLPDGAMITADDAAFVIVHGHPLRWTPFGYEPVDKIPRVEGLLTPPSTLAALRAGYRPVLHASAEA